MNVPIFQSTHWREYSDSEADVLKNVMTSLDDNYQSSVSKLVKLRTKGMYVDILEGKISTPKDVSKKEVEGFYYDAFKFIQYMELVQSTYEQADSMEKKRRRLKILESTRLMQENFEKVASLDTSKEK